jgi:membrane protease YdiL (CAAX protease family)|tara:strand:- start:75 stop:701 length:627 start_codon:yes stop_codon:yes gene_type:complete
MTKLGQSRPRRLQRQVGLNGFSIDSFRLVLVRHGLTMGLLLVLCLGFSVFYGVLFGDGADLLGPAAELLGLLQIGPHHVALILGLLGFVLLHWRWHGVAVRRHHLFWLCYLGFISFAEELVFRLIAPQLLQSALGSIWAVIVSNLIFAGLHYLTLRWRLINCIAAFLGGLGLSRLLQVSDDFILIVLVHGFFTFLNTPQPPTARTKAA